MAAPTDVSIENLTGVWMLQGINWVVRKAIGMTEVTVKIKHFEAPSPTTGNTISQIAISQSTNVNLGGTSETRYLDWQEYPQEDHIFGKTVVQSRFIGNSDGVANPVPSVGTRTETDDPNVNKYLRGKIDEKGASHDGFLVEKAQAIEPLEGGKDGLWIHVVIRSQEQKWIAEQIWGFEVIEGERRYVRRTVLTGTKGNREMARLVYSYVGQNSD
ncbi:Hypothetical protein PENO1_110020 [Penicillium occitanis (nom. inval.)]|nr:Hypothetical protein PENO1_110020 [Penicillium occitanis (nom. inval.)]PCG88611.1 hypothetical protein PENOC_110260 [Penicillium occitanis (nom. inval.)]